ILQPLVENALYHGIKESEHNGRINVRVTKAEDALMMRVEDDGIGMTPERLAQVRAALDGSMDTETGAYGIVNVQERLVLNYGRAYGLTIESTYGKGTICTIRHPLITR
ncbi:MAG: ATP-binding protein, partial [Clostridia bacterium]